MFEGLKVLELASVLAGPAVGQFFAELGATVVKVENAKSGGDVTRTWKAPGEPTDERSAYFCAVNWGKKSIALNLDTPDGRAIVLGLAQQSDIVIASYKPGDAARMGVDYESLSQKNPKLIYAQITGYGSDNLRVGYDAVVQAESGFMFMNGVPGGPSQKMPVALVDILAAHHLKEAILLALLRQTKSGAGDFVEVSLIQAAIASLANQATNWLVGGTIPQKQGSAHPNIAPYGDVFITADGQEILLAIGSDRQFIDLCDAMDIREVASDHRFSTNQARVANRALLNSRLQEKFKDHGADSILKELHKARIPVGRVQSLNQVFALPEAKELLLTSPDRAGVKTYLGKVRPKNIPHFLPPPRLGEHTAEILRESLQMSAQAIQNVIANGSVR